VYHNIPGDKQKWLLETLRVLKKGVTFAIHDIMTKNRYGDMKQFIQILKNMGYEKVELMDTDNGLWMSSNEALLLGLRGSKLLYGKK
jgi:ubiquinone/menaquinone biosynthesis C-methylase UbiE